MTVGSSAEPKIPVAGPSPATGTKFCAGVRGTFVCFQKEAHADLAGALSQTVGGDLPALQHQGDPLGVLQQFYISQRVAVGDD